MAIGFYFLMEGLYSHPLSCLLHVAVIYLHNKASVQRHCGDFKVKLPL